MDTPKLLILSHETFLICAFILLFDCLFHLRVPFFSCLSFTVLVYIRYLQYCSTSLTYRRLFFRFIKPARCRHTRPLWADCSFSATFRPLHLHKTTTHASRLVLISKTMAPTSRISPRLIHSRSFNTSKASLSHWTEFPSSTTICTWRRCQACSGSDLPRPST